MKNLFFVFLSGCFLYACTKSTDPVSGEWLLYKKYESTGAYSWEIVPAPDSAVILSLNTDHRYTTFLNGKTVSSGTYTLSPDPGSYFNDSLLELNHFQTTGIFSLFAAEEVNSQGQVIAVYDAFAMKTVHDTLVLAGAMTPGGNISYRFIRK